MSYFYKCFLCNFACSVCIVYVSSLVYTKDDLLVPFHFCIRKFLRIDVLNWIVVLCVFLLSLVLVFESFHKMINFMLILLLHSKFCMKDNFFIELSLLVWLHQIEHKNLDNRPLVSKLSSGYVLVNLFLLDDLHI